MIERYLPVWLVVLSLAAFFWPALGAQEALGDPFVASRPALSWLIALTMFAVGSLLPRDEVRQVARRWPSVLGGTTIQYTAMPLLAYGLALAFRLGPDATVGLVIVGCVPGAMASNVLTLAARGNVSYSVGLTTSATLLSPLVVPLALKWTLRAQAEIDALAVCLKLLREVVGPVVAGYVLSRHWDWFEVRMRRAGPPVAHLAILWIIAVVVAVNRQRAASIDGKMLSALLAVNLLGYAAGYTGGFALRLPEPMRRALTLEVGMQNAGLGTVLALSLFADRPAAAIPPAIYTFGCMLTGTLLASVWSRFRPVPAAAVHAEPIAPPS